MILGAVAGAPAGSGGGPPGSMDDDFSGVSLDAKWTRRANGASTINLAGGIATFTADPASPSPTVHQMKQPLPGVGRWRARVAAHAATNFAVVGMHVRDSSSGLLIVVGWHKNSFGRRLIAIRFTSETAYGGNLFEDVDTDPDNFQYVEIEITATNLILRHSFDGSSWTDFVDATFDTYATGFVPTEIGFAVTSFGAGTPTLDIDDFTQEA